MKKQFLLSIIFLLILSLSSTAIDLYPSGNTIGRNIYSLINFSTVSATYWTYPNGTNILDGLGGGSEATTTDNKYLYLIGYQVTLNETKLNSTIDARIPSITDTNDTTAVNILILRVDTLNSSKVEKLDFSTQNTTIWTAINNRGVSNLTLTEVGIAYGNATQVQLNLVLQNTSLWNIINDMKSNSSGWTNESGRINTSYVDIYFGNNGSDGNKTIYFWESGGYSKFIRWSDPDTAFLISGRVISTNGYTSYGNIGTTGNADIYTGGSAGDLWLGTSTQSASNNSLFSNGTTRAIDLRLSSLAVASCDVKAVQSDGTLYCGIDATGSSSELDGLNNSHTLSLNNITDFSAQNNSYFSTFGKQVDLTNLSGNDSNRVRNYDLTLQNTTYFSTWWKIVDGQLQNTSIWNTISNLYTNITLKGNLSGYGTTNTLAKFSGGILVDSTFTDNGTHQSIGTGAVAINFSNSSNSLYIGSDYSSFSFSKGISSTLLQVTSLTSASCDVKAYTNGTIYCGTDATGASSEIDGLNNSHTHKVANITDIDTLSTWTNTTSMTTTIQNITINKRIVFNENTSNNPSISAGLNADGERSLSIRSNQSADYYLGADGFFNIYNRTNAWIAYVRETDGNLYTRNYGNAQQWNQSYANLSYKLDITAFSTQNNSYFSTFGKQVDLTNLSGNDSNRARYYDVSLQNTTTWSAINGKSPAFANSTTVCSSTDKVTSVNSTNGLITINCATDIAGSGGVDMTTISSNSTGLQIVNSTWVNITVAYPSWQDSHTHNYRNMTGYLSNASGFENDSTYINTSFRLNTGGSVNITAATQALLTLKGTSSKVLFYETDAQAWSMVLSGGLFLFKNEDSSQTGSFNVRNNLNNDLLSVDMSINQTILNTSVRIIPLNSANCDVKAYTNGTLYCGTDATTAGVDWFTNSSNVANSTYAISTSEHLYQHGVPVRDFQSMFCDFSSAYVLASMCAPDFTGAASGTGGIGARTGVLAPMKANSVFGLINFSKGTAANSGLRFGTTGNTFRLNGSERFSAKVSYAPPKGGNTTITIMGFDVPTTVGAVPTNGVYFVVENKTVWGQISTNSVYSNTSNFSSLEYNNASQYPFYTFVIDIKNTTNVNFSIYNNNDTLIWSANASSFGIPSTTGREVDCDMIIGSKQASTAALPIATVDFMLCEVETFRRIY